MRLDKQFKTVTS